MTAERGAKTTEKVTTFYPNGRVRVVERVFAPEAPPRVGWLLKLRPKPKAETLRDNKKIIYPPQVLRSLRVILPEALSLTGEDQEIFKQEKEREAQFPLKRAVLELISANRGKDVSTRKVAEQLVHSNPTYQKADEFGRVLPDMEEGWVSDVETALSDNWPTEQEINEFLNGTS